MRAQIQCANIGVELDTAAMWITHDRGSIALYIDNKRFPLKLPQAKALALSIQHCLALAEEIKD